MLPRYRSALLTRTETSASVSAVDYAKAAIKSAKLVIAEVNKNMPRTFGDSFVSAEDIDYFIEVDYPLIELKPAELTDVELKIGEHCASLVEDGATCLQLGIGSLPDAVLGVTRRQEKFRASLRDDF